ncbi:MAG: M15 family metallopeptidase [Myxococcales bacterium]|nr:M15 family metallopeptidase [Myxococcales bacterium]
MGALVTLLLALAADAPPTAACLVEAYPDHLCGATATELVWCDGTRMPWVARPADVTAFEDRLNAADLRDQLEQRYPMGAAWQPPPGPDFDPGRLRSEAFFRKMYGGTAAEVEKKTKAIQWFGHSLRVTTINGVHEKLAAVAAELEKLPRAQHRFFTTPAGTFVWRAIKGTDGKRMSMHSFAIAIDVGVKYADYWRWAKAGPDGRAPWRNRFPDEVVAAFERHGFIWGGKWDHFDTMHFEYRPELLHPACVASTP